VKKIDESGSTSARQMPPFEQIAAAQRNTLMRNAGSERIPAQTA